MVVGAIALAPTLPVMVVGAVHTAKADSIVVGVALAVLDGFVAVTAPTAVVPIVAAVIAASNCFVEVSVAVEEQKLAQRELCDHCECAARCTTLQGLPTR